MSRTFRPFRLQPSIVVPRLNLVVSLGVPPQLLRREVLHPLRQGSARRPLGFTFPRGGSPRRQTESSSSSYGLVIHLLVLSTSHHWDAVPFGYGMQIPSRRGLPPRWFSALADAPWRTSVRSQMAGPPARQRIDIRPGRPGSCQPTEVGQGQVGRMPSLPVKQSGEMVGATPSRIGRVETVTG